MLATRWVRSAGEMAMQVDPSWERSSSDSVKRSTEGNKRGIKGEGRREEKGGGKWEEREKGRRREESSYIFR